MKNNNIVIIAVVALIVGAAGFFGGMKYQQSKGGANFSRQFPGGTNNRQGATNNQARLGGNGRPVTGEILSLDDKSITIKLQDGSSKIVLIPDSAIISKTDQGSKSDLKKGDKVGVFGTDNTDGTITAQNVQLNPAFRGAQDRPQPTVTK